MFDCIVNRWKAARELFAELNVFLENADFLSSSFGNVLYTYAYVHLQYVHIHTLHSFPLLVIKTELTYVQQSVPVRC